MSETIYGRKTISLINELHNQGITRFSVIMRHSARHYDEDVQMEPFMPLTSEGKTFAKNYGAMLPAGLSARFFSSYIGRCIETAYLVDKGFTTHKSGNTTSNTVSKDISPFYIVDFTKLITIILEQETSVFIRNWINGKLPETTIMSAKTSVDRMLSFMTKNFQELPENSIDISVTHDWNIYLLKELGLGLKHEDNGAIDYLEGLVLFEKEGDIYLANHQSEPQKYVMP